jgi:hypothetical protein
MQIQLVPAVAMDRVKDISMAFVRPGQWSIRVMNTFPIAELVGTIVAFTISPSVMAM